MQIQQVLERFDGVKALKRNSWQVKCPVHKDERASVSVTDVGEKILIHCHAGCDAGDILKAVGLTFKDLCSAEKHSPKMPGWQGECVDKYAYEDENGRVLYYKLRFRAENGEKSFCFARLIRGKWIKGRGDIEPVLFNLPELKKAIQEGRNVFIVEGEKDAKTLKAKGFVATTAGSVSDWNDSFGPIFIGANVVILPDNDEAGRRGAGKIAKSIRPYAFSTCIVTTSNAEKGDVTDYFNAGATVGDFKRLIKNAKKQYAKWARSCEDAECVLINTDLLSLRFLKNHDLLFVRKKGAEDELVYIYSRGVYEPISTTELERMIGRYIPAGTPGVKIPSVVKIAAKGVTLNINESHVINFDRLNSNERFINVQNGLYDILTRKLMPHDSNVLSSIQYPVKYLADAEYTPPERWLKFINDLCTDCDGEVDKEMVLLLQEYIGFVLSPLPGSRIKKSLYLYSEIGNTGKSLLCNILARIIGENNVASTNMAMLCDNRFGSSHLYGKRLAIVGDQTSAPIRDSAVFKQLTGGDTLYAEFKGKQAFDFKFGGFLIFAGNHLPNFRDDKGQHIFDRMTILHCRHYVEEKDRNRFLFDDVCGELDQIFRWGLEGLNRLLSRGFEFTQCQSSDELMSVCRHESDTVYAFTDQYCFITGETSDRIRSSEFWEKFEEYQSQNGILDKVSRYAIRERMASIGINCIKYQGIDMYRGIRWREEE